jgi:HSP20 family protein
MAKTSLPSIWGRRAQTLDLGETFGALQHEIDRVFDDFGRLRFGRSGLSLGAPRIDVSETDGEYVIEAELPGVDPKEVEVSLDGDVLSIKGEKKIDREDKSKDYHVVERAYGAFERSIVLPFKADEKKIQAKFTNGVLRITAPKPAEAKTEKKKIEIAAS